MPSMCSNNGYIKLPPNASPKAREAFEKLAKNEAKDGWFGSVLPCPPELCLGLNGTRGCDDFMSVEWLKENSRFTGDFGSFNSSQDPKFTPTSDYKKYLETTFGSADWYNWNVANYGVKWDVHPELHSDDDTISFSFGSAWESPTTFFDNLAHQYGLYYGLRYSGNGFAGITYYDGQHGVVSDIQDHETYQNFIDAHGETYANEEVLKLIKDSYPEKHPIPTVRKKSKGATKAAAQKVSISGSGLKDKAIEVDVDVPQKTTLEDWLDQEIVSFFESLVLDETKKVSKKASTKKVGKKASSKQIAKKSAAKNVAKKAAPPKR